MCDIQKGSIEAMGLAPLFVAAYNLLFCKSKICENEGKSYFYSSGEPQSILYIGCNTPSVKDCKGHNRMIFVMETLFKEFAFFVKQVISLENKKISLKLCDFSIFEFFVVIFTKPTQEEDDWDWYWFKVW